MEDRIQIKQNGVYITLPELIRQHGKLLLEYKPAADQIQVKTLYDDENGQILVNRSIGALKHRFRGDE